MLFRGDKIDNRGTGIRHSERSHIYNYYVLGTSFIDFTRCWFDCQHYSDGDIYSGTDSDIRSKDYSCILGIDALWSMDFE